MKKIALAAFGLLLGLSIVTQNACYYDNEEELYGVTPGACDTTNVKYSSYVKAAFDAHCTTCHAPGGSQEGSPMETYDNLKVYIDNGAVADRINNASNPMPPTGLIPDCDRKKIQAWINAGAPNN